MKTGFHVGVLVYQENNLIAWVSVGPIIDTYWFWRRVAQLGDEAKTTAGITCLTIAPEHRGKGTQSEILKSLVLYGRVQGWTAIEGYPFDQTTFEQHGKAVSWPGHTAGFEDAAFSRIDKHWLSQDGWNRSIFRRNP